MVALETPKAEIGWSAPDFELLGVDGNSYSLSDVRGKQGLLVLFICNHCPYVQRQMDRIISAAWRLQELDIGVVAISANDAENYPEDSFENMKRYADEQGFFFPYLYDETQAVARAYGAVCTPDFFGFNANLALHYRGRLDGESGEELLAAMKEIATAGQTDRPQNPSIGCSIKWRRDAA